MSTRQEMKPLEASAYITGVVATLLCNGLYAGDCAPQWEPTFGAQPGVTISPYPTELIWVDSFATFDDGNGDALYVGGPFRVAGSVLVNGIAKWDGNSWSSLGAGLGPEASVNSMVVFDDGAGGGPALYAGGSFTTAGGVAANNIAKWDGTSWSPLGTGTASTGLGAAVHTLAVFDDGSGGGPALYVGGDFGIAGGMPVNFIAKWDGREWSTVGNGLNERVRSLAVFDGGSGPALYVGGIFTTAGPVIANRVAKWDGANWSAVGTGMGGSSGGVYSLAEFDDGSGDGPALYAGGTFVIAGGQPANRIAKWDGMSWSALGVGVSGPQPPAAIVRDMQVFDDGSGSGPALFATGYFTEAGGDDTVRSIAKWDGRSWTPLGAGLTGGNTGGYALAVLDDGSGSGPSLFAGGDFGFAGGVQVNSVAKLDGESWSGLGSGLTNSVQVLEVLDDGSGGGPELVAGGSFAAAGGMAVRSIAKWNGESWSPFGNGLGGSVNALAIFDDGSGSGPALHAGGDFSISGIPGLDSIGKWNGAAWEPLDSGIDDGTVHALTVFDDGLGGGPALYVGGEFDEAGAATTSNIAKWDGTTWSDLGSATNSDVRALAVFDDGSGGGPALYVGGQFTTAGGAPHPFIARWNGSSWSGVGGGMNSSVHALIVFDDGSGDGPALYAGGLFTTAGGAPANGIAKWDGVSWSALGSGVTGGAVNALAAQHDESSGAFALYAAGTFTTAGGEPANRIAKWDGNAWTPLDDSGLPDMVNALTILDDGSGNGPSLFAGGRFGQSPAGDSYLARWRLCPPEPECASADLNCDGVVDGLDLGNLLANWSIPPDSPGCNGMLSCAADINRDGVVDGIDLGILLANWTI